ncbi:MAG: efflux RND transporter periplasmic adaptor subunit [Opitutales bacterium]|nr:efflux RND transporter periplasmic adaptor subunit [Opitutales bacterium]
MKPKKNETLLSRALLPVSAGLAALALTACGGSDGADGNAHGEMPPPPVVAVAVQPENVDVEVTYAGRVRGLREVQVRARAGGILEERLYSEGQYVEKGAPLFRIEREPYEIALRAAEADLANARAAAGQAAREWRRISGLHEQNAVSDRERDRAQAEDELAQARLALAEARVEEARLNLDYTVVKAPAAGPTGLESLPEGSLIERGTLLTTIVQQDPVQVRFALPERDAVTHRTARRAMVDPGGDHRYAVRMVLPDGRDYGREGVVDFTDSTVDARTGSVQARALFDNPDGDLVPGQFVRVRLSLQQLEDVFPVPPPAVIQGREGPRIFVVKSDDTVEARNVRLGPVVDGKQVVLEGLESGDRIVVSGLVNLHPGMTVSPQFKDGE